MKLLTTGKSAPVALVLGLLSGLFLSLSPAACSQDCQVHLAGTEDPYLSAQQSCWGIRSDNGRCDDVGKAPTCEGTTLSCPEGMVLGKDCPGNPFGRPDAGP